MIKFLYYKVTLLKKKNKKSWKFFYKLNKMVINILYPIFQLFNSSYGLDDSSNIIISLTSFPKRINSVWLTISTLLNQSIKSKKIILWLAEEQFPNHKLPYNLKRLCKRGLEVHYCDDLKSHKKYFYTLKEYSDFFIITVDDDILYPEDFVENLKKNSVNYPNTVLCNWAHKITFDNNGEYNPYIFWKHSSNEMSNLIVPIGCCGVLYPPNSLNKEVFDKDKIKKLALYCDDLWLKCMALKNNISAINVNTEDLIYFNNIRNQHFGLWKQNVLGENRNDIVWHDLMSEYKELDRLLKGDI